MGRRRAGAPRKPPSQPIAVRLPVLLKVTLDALAKTEGRSRNNLIVRLLQAAIQADVHQEG